MALTPRSVFTEYRAAKAAVETQPRQLLQRLNAARAHTLAAEQIEARVVALPDAAAREVIWTLHWAAFEFMVGAWLVRGELSGLIERLEELEPEQEWSALAEAAATRWSRHERSAGLALDPALLEQTRLRVRRLTAALVDELGVLQWRLGRAARRRTSWVVALAFGLMLLLGVLVWLGQRLLEPGPDVAAGRPWQASSGWDAGPAQGRKPERTSGSFFFSTELQLNPWWQVDLEQTRPVVAVAVYNRDDCCEDRAVPLSLSVSEDGRQWREVARRTEPFKRHVFDLKEPAAARFVRLRVERRSWLHLRDVQVYTRE